jgi:hypothetical protein
MYAYLFCCLMYWKMSFLAALSEATAGPWVMSTEFVAKAGGGADIGIGIATAPLPFDAVLDEDAEEEEEEEEGGGASVCEITVLLVVLLTRAAAAGEPLGGGMADAALEALGLPGDGGMALVPFLVGVPAGAFALACTLLGVEAFLSAAAGAFFFLTGALLSSSKSSSSEDSPNSSEAALATLAALLATLDMSSSLCFRFGIVNL